jgi:hypothetical protein
MRTLIFTNLYLVELAALEANIPLPWHIHCNYYDFQVPNELILFADSSPDLTELVESGHRTSRE